MSDRVHQARNSIVSLSDWSTSTIMRYLSGTTNDGGDDYTDLQCEEQLQQNDRQRGTGQTLNIERVDPSLGIQYAVLGYWNDVLGPSVLWQWQSNTVDAVQQSPGSDRCINRDDKIWIRNLLHIAFSGSHLDSSCGADNAAGIDAVQQNIAIVDQISRVKIIKVGDDQQVFICVVFYCQMMVSMDDQTSLPQAESSSKQLVAQCLCFSLLPSIMSSDYQFRLFTQCAEKAAQSLQFMQRVDPATLHATSGDVELSSSYIRASSDVLQSLFDQLKTVQRQQQLVQSLQNRIIQLPKAFLCKCFTAALMYRYLPIVIIMSDDQTDAQGLALMISQLTGSLILNLDPAVYKQGVQYRIQVTSQVSDISRELLCVRINLSNQSIEVPVNIDNRLESIEQLSVKISVLQGLSASDQVGHPPVIYEDFNEVSILVALLFERCYGEILQNWSNVTDKFQQRLECKRVMLNEYLDCLLAQQSTDLTTKSNLHSSSGYKENSIQKYQQQQQSRQSNVPQFMKNLWQSSESHQRSQQPVDCADLMEKLQSIVFSYDTLALQLHKQKLKSRQSYHHTSTLQAKQLLTKTSRASSHIGGHHLNLSGYNSNRTSPVFGQQKQARLNQSQTNQEVFDEIVNDPDFAILICFDGSSKSASLNKKSMKEKMRQVLQP
ncbi:hypothetical protein MP228_005689 [Amoeboaphelidium protococcarum]|nr:hypothetical protein MP228_005689 [Amoeboaphelidium protococcarum]